MAKKAFERLRSSKINMVKSELGQSLVGKLRQAALFSFLRGCPDFLDFLEATFKGIGGR